MSLLVDIGAAAVAGREVPNSWRHAAAAGQLPAHHRDPMLIAQAATEDLTIATVDPAFSAYDVAVV